MPQLRYLTPFAFLALVPLGGWLGGAWTFSAAAATPLCLVGLDAMLGEERGPADRIGTPVSRWFPRLYVFLQLGVNAWAAVWVVRPDTGILEAVGLAVSTGVTTGVFGFVAAHEMIHSRESGERALGLALLASVFYMQFRIAHVYGHHRRAATFEDPATARLGEGLYAFVLRSVTGQFREAWTFEAERLRRRGRRAIGARNRMLLYVAVEAALIAVVAIFSWRSLLFLIAVALIAVLLLETFNYIAHYGLVRGASSDGRVERLAPEHSWNSGRRMNNAALFNMGRHSHHHRAMTRSYEGLEPLATASTLPSGYASALLTAFVPPLWRRTMDGRVAAVRRSS
jgi:alkane 1-monooxygenase